MMISIKSAQEAAKMRDAGKIVAETFELLREAVKPGVSTWELDKIAHRNITKYGAVPSFLNYNGFPASICVSKNEIIIHGIPSKGTILADGDIISIDIGAYYHGYHGDSAKTFPVGSVSQDAQKLIDVTRQSFYEGIQYALDGYRLHDIGGHIEQYVKEYGFDVVRNFVGHGVGTNLHEEPEVPNFGKIGTGVRLHKGMTIAIEPMVTMGNAKNRTLKDGWTVVTNDGKWSAHYEHTILITGNEPEILTRL